VNVLCHVNRLRVHAQPLARLNDDNIDIDRSSTRLPTAMTVTETEVTQALLSDSHSQRSQEQLRELRWQQYVDHHLRLITTHLLHSIRPAQLTRLAKRFGFAISPTLLRSWLWGEQPAQSKRFPTSYLNGLRGVTAVKVFTFHYTFVFSDFGFQPWGVNERHMYFLELPIIRYFYSGFTSHVFFGIAGYLTSLRLFQLLEKNDATNHSKVLLNVSGSLFRRALRLYLPLMIITLITTTYIYFGFYEFNRPLILDHVKLFPGDWYEPKPVMAATYSAQIRHWCHEMFDITNIVTENTVYPYHDQHLWSILSEMRASLHLYGILIAVAQCKPHVRIIVMFFLTFMYFIWNHWEIWVYILGGIVAQIDVILTNRDKSERESLELKDLAPIPNGHAPGPNGHAGEPSPPPPPQISKPTHEFPSLPKRLAGKYTPSLRSIIRLLCFLAAFYLLSYPIDGARDYAPGYITLNKLIPEWMQRKDKFYPNIGTALLLLLLCRSNPTTSKWRRFLDSEIPQYLGKISFALYLVHGPIMHAVGYMVPHKVAWAQGKELIKLGDWEWAATIGVGWVFTLTVALWAADVWTREVEKRCVKLVKDLEGVCFVGKNG
jgi:peptidoglycan/LPS O-acetylase OafA/YrhL